MITLWILILCAMASKRARPQIAHDPQAAQLAAARAEHAESLRIKSAALAAAASAARDPVKRARLYAQSSSAALQAVRLMDKGRR